MATRPASAAISEEHRARQIAIRVAITAQLLQIWGGMDVADIDRSWATIEPAVLAVVENGRRVSELVSADYYRRFREAERAPGVPAEIVTGEAAWKDAARASLEITGPIAAKKAILANAPRPLEVAFVRMSGAGARLVANGGRDVLLGAMKKDRHSLGYARVTSGRPCAFCAMLSGRGPIYRSSGTAGFHAHDHCSCFPEPVYDRKTKWPGRGREFHDLYRESTRGEDNPAAAFRRAYENDAGLE